MTKEQLDAIRVRMRVGGTFAQFESAALLLVEVERLQAERDAAFQRGAEAMREAAASYLVFENRPHYAEEVLSLPIPEYNNGN